MNRSAQCDILIPHGGLQSLKPVLGDALKSRRIITAHFRRPRKNRCAFVLTDTTSTLADVTSTFAKAHRYAMNVSSLVLFYRSGHLPVANAFIESLQPQFKLKHIFLADDPATVKRLILAQEIQAQRKLIASAVTSGDELLVWSCEPRLYRIPFAKVPSLARLSDRERAVFSISDSGSRIHWDAGDIDLTLETLLSLADPVHEKDLKRKRPAEMQRYASGIRHVRAKVGLRQDECGISEREMRRLEKGETMPHSSTLTKLAKAHALSLDAYLDRVAKASAEGRRVRS